MLYVISGPRLKRLFAWLKLNLRKTSFSSRLPRIYSKDLLSDGEVASATLTAEKELLHNSGSLEKAGILRKFSKYYKHSAKNISRFFIWPNIVVIDKRQRSGY